MQWPGRDLVDQQQGVDAMPPLSSSRRRGQLFEVVTKKLVISKGSGVPEDPKTSCSARPARRARRPCPLDGPRNESHDPGTCHASTPGSARRAPSTSATTIPASSTLELETGLRADGAANQTDDAPMKAHDEDAGLPTDALAGMADDQRHDEGLSPGRLSSDIVTFVGPAIIACMRTNAAKLEEWRAAGRGRTAKRRAGMAERGRPETTTTDYALSEALSFLIAKSLVSTLNADAAPDRRALRDDMALKLTDIRDVALEILVDRQGYNSREARIALGHRLGLRKKHAEPDFIPSLRPNRSAQSRRAGQATLP